MSGLPCSLPIAPPTPFGDLLRQAREDRGRSCAQIARELGISAPFLHQIEVGTRGPLSRAKMHRASVCLRVSRAALEAAALTQRGDVLLPKPEGEAAIATTGRLSAAWEELPPAFFAALDQLLDAHEKGGG